MEQLDRTETPEEVEPSPYVDPDEGPNTTASLSPPSARADEAATALLRPPEGEAPYLRPPDRTEDSEEAPRLVPPEGHTATTTLTRRPPQEDAHATGFGAPPVTSHALQQPPYVAPAVPAAKATYEEPPPDHIPEDFHQPAANPATDTLATPESDSQALPADPPRPIDAVLPNLVEVPAPAPPAPVPLEPEQPIPASHLAPTTSTEAIDPPELEADLDPYDSLANREDGTWGYLGEDEEDFLAPPESTQHIEPPLEIAAPLTPTETGATPFEAVLEAARQSDADTVKGQINTNTGHTLYYEADTRPQPTTGCVYLNVSEEDPDNPRNEPHYGLQATFNTDNNSVEFGLYTQMHGRYHPDMPSGTAHNFVRLAFRHFESLELQPDRVEESWAEGDSIMYDQYQQALQKTRDPLAAASATTTARWYQELGFQPEQVRRVREIIEVTFSRPEQDLSVNKN